MEATINKTYRNWLMTLNNPGDNTMELLDDFYTKSGAVYACGQLEQGKEGTLHLQFFLNFKTGVKMGKIKKLDSRLHIEPVLINNGAHTYCMKDETRVDGPWEFGAKPVQRNNKTDWSEVKLKAKTNRLEEIPDDIYVKYYSTLKRIAKDNIVVTDSDDLRGLWIYGQAGLGKSYIAKTLAPGYYPKTRNEWWEGYKGEKIVVLNDIDKYDVKLAGSLKDWADRYGIIVGNKGSSIPSNWDVFIVTSQYGIDDIFIDLETREALHRRYIKLHLLSNGQYEIIPRTESQIPNINIGEISQKLLDLNLKITLNKTD